LANRPFDRAPEARVAMATDVAVTLPVVPVEFCVATNKLPSNVPLPVPIVRLSPPAALCAVATGAEATVNIPANRAVVAVSAMRLRSVVFDIFFLSLVRIRNFPTLARRSFDPLIPFPCGTHV